MLKNAGEAASDRFSAWKGKEMTDIKYEKLDRIRSDIKRDRDKVAKLQEQIKQKEAKLKEAEASQIVADVGAMNMSPEQLGQFLALIQSGKISALMDGGNAVPGMGNSASNTAGRTADEHFDDADEIDSDESDESDDENEDMEDIDDEN